MKINIRHDLFIMSTKTRSKVYYVKNQSCSESLLCVKMWNDFRSQTTGEIIQTLESGTPREKKIFFLQKFSFMLSCKPGIIPPPKKKKKKSWLGPSVLS